MVDTCHLRPLELGKERTYTLFVPPSSDTYATAWPSGENVPAVSRLSVTRNGSGVPMPVAVIGSTHRSSFVRGSTLVYMSQAPSRDHDVGKATAGERNTRFAVPAPSVARR